MYHSIFYLPLHCIQIAIQKNNQHLCYLTPYDRSEFLILCYLLSFINLYIYSPYQQNIIFLTSTFYTSKRKINLVFFYFNRSFLDRKNQPERKILLLRNPFDFNFFSKNHKICFTSSCKKNSQILFLKTALFYCFRNIFMLNNQQTRKIS